MSPARSIDGVRVPELVLASTSVATTYRFHEPGPLGCWACCTVNDATGELTIQSDWGSWCYRWSSNPKHLGSPTLTHFLGEMDHTDYVARKLNREGHDEERFSPKKTAAVLKERLLEMRREHARMYGVDCSETDYLPMSPVPAWRFRRLSRRVAREIWDGLSELVADLGHTHADAALFFERLPEDIHEYLSDVHEDWRGETRPECIVLRNSILPALFAACKAEIARRAAAVPAVEGPCP